LNAYLLQAAASSQNTVRKIKPERKIVGEKSVRKIEWEDFVIDSVL
jgi:hypothetical protein